MRRILFSALAMTACAKEPMVEAVPATPSAPASASASAPAPAPAPASATATARASAPAPYPPASAIPRGLDRCHDPDPPPCIHLDQGQCTLRQSDGTPVAIPCPDWIRPEGDACAKMLQCHGYSDEGCCVGCNHPMRTRISPACARRIEAAHDCAAVNKAVETPGCAK